jgi:hypothetical protein
MSFDLGMWPDLASRVCKVGILLWTLMMCFIRQSPEDTMHDIEGWEL